MTDLIKSDWKELDSDNTNPSPNGVQGGYAPSTIGPIIRSIRGALKRFYVQSNAAYATTGTGAAYVLTYAAAPQGYSAGIVYRFFAHADNTGAATLNINSLGAKSILSQHGEPLTAGKIKAGKVVEVVYNGTSFELISNEVHDSKFTGTTNIANVAVAGNASIATLSVGPGATAVDGTILANLSTDRPWSIRQRGADGTATLSFENTTDKSIGFSSEVTYTGPKIVLTPTATPSITIDGNTVWHAGNDGSGSTLDSDLLDGQHGAYYRDLANSTGTLPNARISGAYSGITTLSTTGLLTVSNASEALRLSGPAAADDPYMSFYAGGVRTAYIQHSDGTGTGAGFRLFNDVTDDYLYLSNVNNVDALKFYDSSTATHETVLTTGNLTSARVTGALGYTPASNAISITAGSGLTGGGTLGASRTLAVSFATTAEAQAGTVTTKVMSPALVQSALDKLGPGAVAILQDRKSAGTDGGSAVAATWSTRTLTTEVTDPQAIVTLSSNQFTVAADCICEWATVLHRTATATSRIYNVTDSTVAGDGTTVAVSSGAGISDHSIGACLLVSGKTYRLEYYATQARSNDGLGLAVGSGTEIYSQVILRRR